MQHIYSTSKADVRISPGEAEIIGAVERAPAGCTLQAAALKRYRLLMEAIDRVAEWKARHERTKT